jgi:hypothetical protein
MVNIHFKVLVIESVIRLVLAKHINCPGIALSNIYTDATEACFGEPLATNMRSNFLVVYDKSPVMGTTSTYGFVANGHFTNAVVVRSP